MMGEVKNLYYKEDIAVLKNLVEEIKICMFCSNLNIIPLTSRPMSIHQVDDEGNIWFISSKESNKNFEKVKDKRVQLFFTSMADSYYLSVFGDVSIYNDKEAIDKIWNPIANAWFEESLNDSTVIVIKVVPTNVYYWDSNENKILLNVKNNTKNSKEYSEIRA